MSPEVGTEEVPDVIKLDPKAIDAKEGNVDEDKATEKAKEAVSKVVDAVKKKTDEMKKNMPTPDKIAA